MHVKEKAPSECRRNLKAARKEAGLSQQAVAKKIGVGLRHYKKIEAGETVGSIPVWDALEDLFCINQRVLREIHPYTRDSQ